MRTVILLFLAGCLDSNDGSTDTMGSGGTCDMAAEYETRTQRCQEADITIDDLTACCSAAGAEDCADRLFSVDLGRGEDCATAYCMAYYWEGACNSGGHGMFDCGFVD